MAKPTPNARRAALLTAGQKAQNERLAKVLADEFRDGTRNLSEAEYLAYLRRNWPDAAWRRNEAQRISARVLLSKAMQAFGRPMPDEAGLSIWNQQQMAALQAALRAAQAATAPGLTAPVLAPGRPPLTGP